MARLSSKLRSIEGGNFAHWCPGCEEMHAFYVGTPTSRGARWSFDGNVEKPSFTPSMNITSPRAEWGDGEVAEATCCHYFLSAGFLQFLGDCTHALKGQTVELPDLPPDTGS